MNKFYQTLSEFKQYVTDNIGPCPEFSDNDIMMLVVFHGFMQGRADCILQACTYAAQTLRNLGNGFLTGDARLIAMNEAANLERVAEQ